MQRVGAALACVVVAAGVSGCGGAGHRAPARMPTTAAAPPANPTTAAAPPATPTTAAAPPATPTTAAAPPATPPEARIYGGPAPLLVYFKRAVGEDPLASQLIVDTDGSAAALVTFGGLSGQRKHLFTMPSRQLRRLRELMAGTRLRDTWCCDARYYIYWVTFGGRSWRLQQRRVPRSMRPLIHDLDAITDAHTGY